MGSSFVDDFAVVRYNPDGSLDDGGASDSSPGDAFGSSGLVTTTLGSGFDAAYGVAVQEDGKIVAGGNANNAGNQDFALARYNADSSLNNRFNNDGKLKTDFFGGNDDVAPRVSPPRRASPRTPRSVRPTAP